MDNKITIVTTFFNPGKYFDNCLSSVLNQKYDNFNWCITDDGSTDGTFEKIPNDKRIVKIKNDIRKKDALPNIHYFLTELCQSDDIYVNLDGDDFLTNKKEG